MIRKCVRVCVYVCQGGVGGIRTKTHGVARRNQPINIDTPVSCSPRIRCRLNNHIKSTVSTSRPAIICRGGPDPCECRDGATAYGPILWAASQNGPSWAQSTHPTPGASLLAAAGRAPGTRLDRTNSVFDSVLCTCSPASAAELSSGMAGRRALNSRPESALVPIVGL